jgi:plasmid rolling circle replication initiator protein Rep
MAMNMNLLLQQEVKVLWVENERKIKKKARRRATLGDDTILSVQEGLDRVQQLNTQVEIQAKDSTSVTC